MVTCLINNLQLNCYQPTKYFLSKIIRNNDQYFDLFVEAKEISTALYLLRHNLLFVTNIFILDTISRVFIT